SRRPATSSLRYASPIRIPGTTTPIINFVDGDLKMSANLSNARATFGQSSSQYRAILETLEADIAALVAHRKTSNNNATGEDAVEELRGLLQRELNLSAEG